MANDRRRTLVLALLILTLAQLLHGLDLPRTDREETRATMLAATQGLAGLGGSLLAALAVGRRWSADAVEWLGVGIILAPCAWILSLTRGARSAVPASA